MSYSVYQVVELCSFVFVSVMVPVLVHLLSFSFVAVSLVRIMFLGLDGSTLVESGERTTEPGTRVAGAKRHNQLNRTNTLEHGCAKEGHTPPPEGPNARRQNMSKLRGDIRLSDASEGSGYETSVSSANKLKISSKTCRL